MSKIKQALIRKFSETAKGWYWNKEIFFGSFAFLKKPLKNLSIQKAMKHLPLFA